MKTGTVGVAANDTGRYTIFAASLASLEKPAGSVVRWAMGSDTIAGRNRLVEGIEGDWLWFMDDDHAFAPDLLLRLLRHDLPVVAPVCLMRSRPFYPVELTAEGEALDLTAQPFQGLVELWATGTAGMLIRRDVFDLLEPPWFRHGDISEDYLFCERLRDAGVPIHCDLSARLGHVTTTVVWPSEVDDRWAVGFSVADNFSLYVEIEERVTV